MGYTQPGPFLGGRAHFPEQDYTSIDYATGGFVLNALWNLHQNGYFEEIGFTRGWHTQDTYLFYVAYQKADGYRDYRLATAPKGSGTMHIYTIYRSSDPNEWILKLDDVEFFGVRLDISLTSWQLQVGGEMSSSQSIMNTTIASSLEYFFNPLQGDPQSWLEQKTWCGFKSPMHWAWLSFPQSGKAWAP